MLLACILSNFGAEHLMSCGTFNSILGVHIPTVRLHHETDSCLFISPPKITVGAAESTTRFPGETNSWDVSKDVKVDFSFENDSYNHFEPFYRHPLEQPF